MPLVFAQTRSSLPSGSAEVAIWLVLAAVIVGLYLIIRKTRNTSRRHYLNRQQHEEEMKRRDPDMRDR